MVSMKKVSELSGVSIATVSRVINDNGRFSKSTRKNVLDVIEKLGYTPNTNARALRTNRTRNIGVIVPDITNEFFAKLTLSIQQVLFRENYSTLIYNTDENKRLEKKHLQALTAQSVCGIIFIAGGAYNVDIPDVPTIFLDRKPRLQDRNDFIQIRTNHFEGGFLAGKTLRKAGCKNPCIVMGPKKLFSQAERLRGFAEAYGDAEIPALEVRKVCFTSAYHACLEALNSGAVCDGYFCTTDWLAMGVLKALWKEKIKVPEEAKLVGFDDISIAECLGLTTIRQDMKAMAVKTAKLMLQILNGEKPESNEYIYKAALVRRRTA